MMFLLKKTDSLSEPGSLYYNLKIQYLLFSKQQLSVFC
jgi:hypothetical protein